MQRFRGYGSRSPRSENAFTDVLNTVLVLGVSIAVVGVSAHQLLMEPSLAPAAKELQLGAGIALGDSTLRIRLDAGEPLDAGNVLARVSVNDATIYERLLGLHGTFVSPGDTVTIPLETPLAPGARASVQLIDVARGKEVATAMLVVPLTPANDGVAPQIALAASASDLNGSLALVPSAPFRLDVTVEHPEGRKAIRYVFVDLSALGASSWVELNDAGVEGDLSASDGVFGGVFVVPGVAAPGDIALRVHAVDLAGHAAVTDLMVNVGPVGGIPPSLSPPALPTPPTVPPPSTTLPVVPNLDGSLTPSCTGTVGIEIVGVDITYGATGPPIPMIGWLTRNDGVTLEPLFGGASLAGGQRVEVAATAVDKFGVRARLNGFGLTTTYSSYEASPHVQVLVNGDLPPNVPAFGNQTSIEAYLAPYVEAGRIKLAPNEAIALFEFVGDLSSPAADFQDLVVLFDVVCDGLAFPGGLSAIAGHRRVDLTWEPPVTSSSNPITGYRLYRTDASGNERLVAILRADTSYSDRGLRIGQHYTYRLTTTNATHESLASPPVSAVPVGLPDAPTLTSIVVGDGQLSPTWTRPASDGHAPILHYVVYRWNATGAFDQYTTAGPATTITQSDVTNGEAYEFAVAAVNRVGEGPRSEPMSGTPIGPPGAPISVVATAGLSRVDLSWSSPTSDGGSAVTGYWIHRATGGGAASLLASVGLATSYTDIAVVNNQTYSYQVSAVNAAGEGSLSSASSARPTGPPTAPRSLTATPGDGWVRLSWLTPSSDGGAPVTGYRIHRGPVGGPQTLFATIGTNTSFNATGLVNGVAHVYSVSAVNALGESARSSDVVGTPATRPSAPAAPGATASNARVVLDWTAPPSGGSPITGYRVYRGTTSGSTTLVATVGNVTSFTDTGLTNGRLYYYQVAAVNAMGTGALSAESTARPATVPTAPRSVVATAGVANVTLTWAAPSSDGGSPVTGYQVLRGTSSGALVPVATVGNVTSYVDMGLPAGTLQYYRVVALNAMGSGTTSSLVSARPT